MNVKDIMNSEEHWHISELFLDYLSMMELSHKEEVEEHFPKIIEVLMEYSLEELMVICFRMQVINSYMADYIGEFLTEHLHNTLMPWDYKEWFDFSNKMAHA